MVELCVSPNDQLLQQRPRSHGGAARPQNTASTRCEAGDRFRMRNTLTERAATSSSVFQIVYVSSAVRPFTISELMDLLNRARPRNLACGVTGILLYHDGNFMQLLEGDEANVRATHRRIMRDPRHTGGITLVQKAVKERLFSDWSMGFKQVSPEEAKEADGLSDFLSSGLKAGASLKMEDAAVRLLHTFRDRLR